MIKKIQKKTFKLAKIFLVFCMMYTCFAMPLDVLAEEIPKIDENVASNDANSDANYNVTSKDLSVKDDTETEPQEQDDAVTEEPDKTVPDKAVTDETVSDETVPDEKIPDENQNSNVITTIDDQTISKTESAIKEETTVTETNSQNDPTLDENNNDEALNSEDKKQPIVETPDDGEDVVTNDTEEPTTTDDQDNGQDMPIVTPEISIELTGVTDIGEKQYLLPQDSPELTYKILPQDDSATYKVTIKKNDDIKCIYDASTYQINFSTINLGMGTYTIIAEMTKDGITVSDEVMVTYGEEELQHKEEIQEQYDLTKDLTVEELLALKESYKSLSENDKAILDADWQEQADCKIIELTLKDKVTFTNYAGTDYLVIDGKIDNTYTVSEVKTLLNEPSFASVDIIDRAKLSLANNAIVKNGMIIKIKVTVDSDSTVYPLIIRGDVNCDGAVTVDDLNRAMIVVNEDSNYSPEELLALDLSNDQRFDLDDIPLLATSLSQNKILKPGDEITANSTKEITFKPNTENPLVDSIFQVATIIDAKDVSTIMGDFSYDNTKLQISDNAPIKVYGLNSSGQTIEAPDVKTSIFSQPIGNTQTGSYLISNLESLTNDSNVQKIVIDFNVKSLTPGNSELSLTNTSLIVDGKSETVQNQTITVNSQKELPLQPEENNNPTDNNSQDSQASTENTSQPKPVTTTVYYVTTVYSTTTTENTTQTNSTTENKQESQENIDTNEKDNEDDKKEDKKDDEEVKKDAKKVETDDDDEEEEEKKGSEKVIIIILIILVIVGLLYLIFKKDDDGVDEHSTKKKVKTLK